jgi:hypothetical protein
MPCWYGFCRANEKTKAQENHKTQSSKAEPISQDDKASTFLQMQTPESRTLAQPQTCLCVQNETVDP